METCGVEVERRDGVGRDVGPHVSDGAERDVGRRGSVIVPTAVVVVEVEGVVRLGAERRRIECGRE